MLRFLSIAIAHFALVMISAHLAREIFDWPRRLLLTEVPGRGDIT